MMNMEKFWVKMDEDARRERRRRQRQKCISCIKKLAAFLFSHIGLAAMVVAYSIAGGFLFKALEAPFEVREKMRIREWKEDKIELIWALTVHAMGPALNQTAVLHDTQMKTNFTEHIRVILLEFQGEVTTAVKEKGWDGNDDTEQADLQWSFAGALLYAVTVITTIGYGHVAPKTTWGRLVTIVYALVGIPLTFLYLSNIGNFLADCFRMFYKKICCDLCCCQKCERKKKRERRRLKKQREWAAQRNSVLKATSSSAQYTDSSANDHMLVDDTSSLGDVVVLRDDDDDMAHDNLADNDDENNDVADITVEEGCLGGCPSIDNDPDNERWQDFPDDLKETAIIGDEDPGDVDEFGNVIKETAILDSDTDNEGAVPTSTSTNFGALSDPDRRQSLFTKLDDAKETAILDDSDDEVFTNEHTPTPPPPDVTKSLERKSKSSSEGSKKSKTKSVRAVSPPKEEIVKQPKSALKKEKSVKKKDRGRSSEKEKKDKSESTSSTLSPSRAVPVKDRSSSKSKHRQSKKVKRKDTIRKKRDKDGSKKKKSKSHKSSADSADETRNIMSDECSGPEQVNSDDESFVTARGESASYVGEDGDAVNDAYQGEVITHQPSKGIVTIATEDGVVKYDPDSVAIDVGTNSPYDIELMDYRDLSAAQASALGYMDMEFDEEEEDEKVTVPISICLIIIAGYIFGGAVLFTLWEDWDYLTGSYFCFITLSTIGFGDIVPGTDMKEWASSEKLVLCALWLAFGLSLLAMCFNLMQEEVKEKCKWIGMKLGLLRDEDEG